MDVQRVVGRDEHMDVGTDEQMDRKIDYWMMIGQKTKLQMESLKDE